jgi:hypothetical protein
MYLIIAGYLEMSRIATVIGFRGGFENDSNEV